MDDIWDITHSQFISWQEALANFGFLDTDTWAIGSTMCEWHDILKRDREKLRHGMWVGLGLYMAKLLEKSSQIRTPSCARSKGILWV